MNVLIFSGGVFDKIPSFIHPSDYALTIAADKGYTYAESVGIIPDIFVGDLDSLGSDEQIKSPEIFCLPTEKDMTDTQEAISIAISRGATTITVLGAMGGRMDHQLANIQLLKYGLDQNVPVFLADEDNLVTMINAPTKVRRRPGFCLSLIPYTKCQHVYAKGVYYPLTDAVMELGNTLGISNEFVEEVAEIDPGDGFMLLLQCRA
jgi:thiamine pyrophosphokinase